MKKIINGRQYDTEKAKLLGIDGGGDGFSSWREELYQKRTGEYFLYGGGGPMTKYSKSIGQNSWSGGEKIIPLSAENARKWAEERLAADKYIELFGEPEESADERVTLCVQISADVNARIRRRAAESNVSLSTYINELLANAVR